MNAFIIRSVPRSERWKLSRSSYGKSSTRYRERFWSRWQQRREIEGLSMPPAYTLMNCIHGDEIDGRDNQLLKFKIKYHSSTGKKYVEQQELDFRFYCIVMEARRSITDKNASEMIAKSLQDLVITTETK